MADAPQLLSEEVIGVFPTQVILIPFGDIYSFYSPALNFINELRHFCYSV